MSVGCELGNIHLSEFIHLCLFHVSSNVWIGFLPLQLIFININYLYYFHFLLQNLLQNLTLQWILCKLSGTVPSRSSELNWSWINAMFWLWHEKDKIGQFKTVTVYLRYFSTIHIRKIPQPWLWWNVCLPRKYHYEI